MITDNKTACVCTKTLRFFTSRMKTYINMILFWSKQMIFIEKNREYYYEETVEKNIIYEKINNKNGNNDDGGIVGY